MLSRTSLVLAGLTVLLAAAPATVSAQSRGWSEVHAFCGSTTHAAGHAVHVEPGMRAHAVDFAVAGDVRCRDVAGRQCRGHVYHHPIELRVHHPTVVNVAVTWSDTDPVLALVGPSGSFADDNSGPGRLSRLSAYLMPGTHYLYMGTRHRDDFGHMSVRIAADSPRRPVVVASPPPPPRVVYHPRHGHHRRHGRHHRRHGHHDDDDWHDD